MQNLKTPMGTVKKGIAHFYLITPSTVNTIYYDMPVFEGVDQNNSPNITVVSGTTIKLKAGVKYLLKAWVVGNGDSVSMYTRYGWYNQASATFFGDTGIAIVGTYPGNWISKNNCEAIITPLVDTVVSLRTNDISGSMTLHGGRQCGCIVEELEAYLIPTDPTKYTDVINHTSATGSILIPSGLPIGTKKLIRKLNSSQGTVTITCTGETFTPSNLTSITLNSDGDFWLLEKVSANRWDLLDGRETGTNASGSYTVNANGTQEVTGSNALTAKSLSVNMAKNMGTVIAFSVTHMSSSGNYPPTSWYVVGQPSGSIVNLQYNDVPSSTIVAVINVRGRWY